MYKLLTLPLRLHPFFKYGVPFCYVIRSYNSKDRTHKYVLGWYFNNDGIPKGNKGYFTTSGKLKHYNYSDSKYTGNNLSLKLSYRQLFKLLFR